MRRFASRTAAQAIRRPGMAVALVVAAALAASALAFVVDLATAPVASAASRDNGASFAVRCDFSHRAPDDPIVRPNQPGTAHSHDFFGNKTTSADPTYENMLGKATTCTRLEDTAAYWIPTVKWNGQDLEAFRAVFYYRAGGKNHEKVKPFKADLKVITNKRIRWYCGSDDQKATPPTLCTSGVLGVRIIFPDCSNGQIDSADHKSHMAYSRRIDGKVRCPRSHRIPVPVFTINANFEIPTTPGTVTLSSDEPDDPGGSTMHADFWNTWDQAELERLVVNCINQVPPSEPRPKECRAPTATA